MNNRQNTTPPHIKKRPSRISDPNESTRHTKKKKAYHNKCSEIIPRLYHTHNQKQTNEYPRGCKNWMLPRLNSLWHVQIIPRINSLKVCNQSHGRSQVKDRRPLRSTKIYHDVNNVYTIKQAFRLTQNYESPWYCYYSNSW